MSTSKLLPIIFSGLSFAGAYALPAAAAGSDRTFSILVENVSTDKTLKLADGSTKKVPVAPGAYAIVTKAGLIFQEGKPALKNGLEPLAEDGEAAALIAKLQKTKGVREAGLLIPGQALTVTAHPGERLVFANMFVESNDLFFGSGPGGIALFDASGMPVAGDVTAQIKLWDAGTEMNEAPGSGPNQAPRQKAPHTGARENKAVKPVNGGFQYPAVSEVLHATVEAE